MIWLFAFLFLLYAFLPEPEEEFDAEGRKLAPSGLVEDWDADG